MNTNTALIKKISALTCVSPPFDHEKRRLLVTVANHHYERPSSAIISLEGSPPRFEIYIRLNDPTAPISINGLPPKISSDKKNELRQILINFLKNHSE